MKRIVLSTAMALALGLIGTVGSVVVATDGAWAGGSPTENRGGRNLPGDQCNIAFGCLEQEVQGDAGRGNDSSSNFGNKSNPGNTGEKGNGLDDCGDDSPAGGMTDNEDPAASAFQDPPDDCN